MSVNGQLELLLDEEKNFGFLSFKISGTQVVGNYVLTARLTNEEDKKKYKKWECATVIGLSCHRCKRSVMVSPSRAVVTSETPSGVFSCQRSLDCCGYYNRHISDRFTISIFLYNKTLPEVKFEDKTARFTDETEAKKLNANLKIRFEDSEEPIFVNRELLTVYSNVFRVMFEGDFKEKNAEEINLETKREDFLYFLDCLYVPSVPVTTKNFKAVLIVADRYYCPQLLEKCKKFAEEEAETAATVQECKDFIEMADRYDWNHVVKTAFGALMADGRRFLTELLDCDWMMPLKKSTRSTLFDEVKCALPPAAIGQFEHRIVPFVPERTSRFTDEAEAKEFNANCKICFKDSDAPIFVNRHFLTVYSKVFRVMFEGDFKEKDAEEVELEANREDFLSFLCCLYYPATPVTMYNFKVVTMMADRYDCPELLKNCKEFAERTVTTVNTVEDCQDYIEVSERLRWDNVLMGVISTMKKMGANIFIKFLDSDWIEEREKNTQQALFKGLKDVIDAHLS